MTPRKLTDTQLVLLSAAAQRQDGVIELTGKPKPAVARNALITLLTEGLVEEVPAGSTLPVWRRDDDQGALALRITARGLTALGVETTMAGIDDIPSDLAASSRPCPAMSTLCSSIRTGAAKPTARMLAAICRICFFA